MRRLFVLALGLLLVGGTIGCGGGEKVKKPEEIQPLPAQTQSFGAAGEAVGKGSKK